MQKEFLMLKGVHYDGEERWINVSLIYDLIESADNNKTKPNVMDQRQIHSWYKFIIFTCTMH